MNVNKAPKRSQNGSCCIIQDTFNCQWIDPDGQAYTMSSASLETPDELTPGIYFTYTAYLDLVSDMKEGEWTVQVFLNGESVEIRNLTIQ